MTNRLIGLVNEDTLSVFADVILLVKKHVDDPNCPGAKLVLKDLRAAVRYYKKNKRSGSL